MLRSWNLFLLVWLALAVVLRAADPANVAVLTPEQERFFEEKVRPILTTQCFECHGSKKEESGLRLDSRQAALEGGDSGERAVVPGEPDRSLLVKAINHTGDIHMPPSTKLPQEQIDVLTDWIRQGLPWPATNASSLPQQSAADSAPNHRAD